MAVSSLQRYLQFSLENDVPMIDGPVEPIDEATEQEMNEAVVQCEEVQDEIEVLDQDRQRVETAVDQLEQQNEAIEGVVRSEGELSPAAAAGFEAARRAVAAGLGLNPDEGTGEQIVDQAGLESMIQHRGLIALEENKSMIDKLKDFINGIIDRIRSAWKTLWNWLTKITNILPKQIKPTYQALKALTDEEFKAAKEKLGGADNKYNAVITAGKLRDPQATFREYKVFAGKSEGLKSFWYKFRQARAEAKDGNASEFKEKLKEAYKGYAEKAKGAKFDSGFRTYEYSGGMDGEFPEIKVTENSNSANSIFQLDKGQLLNALNMGLGVNKFVEEMEKMNKATQDVAEEAKKDTSTAVSTEVSTEVVKETQKVLSKVVSQNVNLQKAGQDVVKQVRMIIELAKTILSHAGKAGYAPVTGALPGPKDSK